MKLIIQIPCFNEEESLPLTLKELPRSIPGIESIEWLIVDDGSSDNTVQVAKEHGVDHIIRHSRNMGLAKAFKTGLKACLDKGCDVIVNTDADNQYCAADIPALIEPIVKGEYEFVIGARPIDSTDDFSKIKKFLQKIGSWTVRVASNTDIPDAPSGFRAISRDCAMRLNVFNEYTYTLETIIQAGQKQIPVTWVPVKTNPKLRDSRLFKSIPSYVWRSLVTIIRIFVVYKPFRFFSLLAAIFFSIGVMGNLRFLYLYYTGDGGGHAQSLIVSGSMVGVGIVFFTTALIADMQSVNRTMLEEIRYKMLKKELDG
ncbi:MAG: glycosyltransferase family 2 protein [Bacteroidetes bacterium]|nr:glycosyltransferase family 2 protein [Bacteroidota bacterium]